MPSFLNRDFPAGLFGLRALFPFSLFLFSVFFILLCDTLSSVFFYSFNTDVIQDMQKKSSILIILDHILGAVKNQEKIMDHYKQSPISERFFARIVNNPQTVKFLELFTIKRNNKSGKDKKRKREEV